MIMEIRDRIIEVSFVTKKLEDNYQKLENGKFEEKELYRFIKRATEDLKKDPMCGIKIPKRLWPTQYVREYQIDNLWKYDLPNGWRLIYTLNIKEVSIITIVLEWFGHKTYERRFNY